MIMSHVVSSLICVIFMHIHTFCRKKSFVNEIMCKDLEWKSILYLVHFFLMKFVIFLHSKENEEKHASALT